MSVYDFTAALANGEEISLHRYRGKVLLIVNSATRCAFSSQYLELEKLYRQYREKGFEILDFPCDQFLHQSPKNSVEIAQYCKKYYAISFPLFQKIDVNGSKEIELFHYLKQQKKGFLFPDIKWNFTKFLVDRQGKVIARFAPITSPKSIEKYIQKALEKTF